MKISTQYGTRLTLTRDMRLWAGGCLILFLGWMALVPFGGAEALGFDTDPLPYFWTSVAIGGLFLLAAVVLWFTMTVLIIDTEADLVQLRHIFFGRRNVVGFPFSQLREVVLDEVETRTPNFEGPKQKVARCLFVPEPNSGHKRFQMSASARAASKFRAVRDWAHRAKGIPLER